MSTFTNPGPGDQYLPDQNGKTFRIKPGQTRTLSNYFKRYVDGTTLILAVDDGGVWDSVDNQAAALVRQETKTVVVGTTYSTGAANLTDFATLIGGPAKFVSIETNKQIRVRVNGDANSTFLVNENTTRTFDAADGLAINTLTFDRSMSGASGDATVYVTGAGVPV